MRVVQRAPQTLTIADLMPEAAIGLGSGRFQLVNGDIVEPIECHEDADEERAQRRAADRAIEEHARTGCVHKVVMNMDLPG